MQKSREERLAELKRVRSRIARDLHDDVGSSLTQIALYSEIAKQKQQINEASEKPLEFLVDTSNELIESMSDIVWAINPLKDHLQDLTQRMRFFASESFTTADVEFEFFAPVSERDVPMGANLRREVFLIFKETVNNIFKHLKAENAEIEFTLDKECLILRIKDDGCDFDFPSNYKSELQNGRGGNVHLSMKKRAEELGGSYIIESNIGKGTIITLKIPLVEQLN